MSKQSKILVVTFVVMVLVSIFFTYKRSFLDRDFLIIQEEAEEEIEVVE